MSKTYKIIHPAWIAEYKAIHSAPCRTIRRADARDADAPRLDDHDAANGCVVLVVIDHA